MHPMLKLVSRLRNSMLFVAIKIDRILTPGHFWAGFIVAVLAAFALCDPPPANAGGFALNEQSVSGLGTAYAGGAAQAEDASTIFFNPAGIALLDQGEFQFGGQLVMPQATFNN